jgi:hypothetical protein
MDSSSCTFRIQPEAPEILTMLFRVHLPAMQFAAAIPGIDYAAIWHLEPVEIVVLAEITGRIAIVAAGFHR